MTSQPLGLSFVARCFSRMAEVSAGIQVLRQTTGTILLIVKSLGLTRSSPTLTDFVWKGLIRHADEVPGDNKGKGFPGVEVLGPIIFSRYIDVERWCCFWCDLRRRVPGRRSTVSYLFSPGVLDTAN